MNNIFKKLAAIFCAAVMSSAVLSAMTSAELDSDVHSLASPYISGSTFDLQKWSTDYATFTTNQPRTLTADSRVYFLGSSSQSFNLMDPNTPSTLFFIPDEEGVYVYAGSEHTDPSNLQATPETLRVNGIDIFSIPPTVPYDKAALTLAAPYDATFTAMIKLTGSVSGILIYEDASILFQDLRISASDALKPTDDWRFYDLSGDLEGYYLGAFANDLDYIGIGVTLVPRPESESGYDVKFNSAWIGDVDSRWASLEKGYESMVFLFGPAPTDVPPAPVPEPSVYLLIGTLLVLAYVVGRKKAKEQC